MFENYTLVNIKLHLRWFQNNIQKISWSWHHMVVNSLVIVLYSHMLLAVHNS